MGSPRAAMGGALLRFAVTAIGIYQLRGGARRIAEGVFTPSVIPAPLPPSFLRPLLRHSCAPSSVTLCAPSSVILSPPPPSYLRPPPSYLRLPSVIPAPPLRHTCASPPSYLRLPSVIPAPLPPSSSAPLLRHPLRPLLRHTCASPPSFPRPSSVIPAPPPPSSSAPPPPSFLRRQERRRARGYDAAKRIVASGHQPRTSTNARTAFSCSLMASMSSCV